MTDISVLYESKHIEWSIPTLFEELEEDYFVLESDCFFLSHAEWHLEMRNNVEIKNGRRLKYISLFLLRTESVSKHDVVCRMGIKNNYGTEFNGEEFKHTFSKEEGYLPSGIPLFIKKSELLRCKETVAPNGTLTVFCTLKIVDGPITSSAKVESKSQTDYDGTSTLIKELQDMYFSSFQSDLLIIVQNKEFRAHRFILSSRSSVFKSMFLHDMMEKNSGSIEIPDGDPDTFEDFLLFLYTGKFDNVSTKNAVSLYSAADKYDVKDLKDECARCMIDGLSDDIFCDVLHLATMQNDTDLLQAVTDYFIRNAKSIVITTKWHAFLVEHPVVANELFYKQLIWKDNIEKQKNSNLIDS